MFVRSQLGSLGADLLRRGGQRIPKILPVAPSRYASNQDNPYTGPSTLRSIHKARVMDAPPPPPPPPPPSRYASNQDGPYTGPSASRSIHTAPAPTSSGIPRLFGRKPFDHAAMAKAAIKAAGTAAAAEAAANAVAPIPSAATSTGGGGGGGGGGDAPADDQPAPGFWEGLSTPKKVAIVGGGLAVLGLGIYALTRKGGGSAASRSKSTAA